MALLILGLVLFLGTHAFTMAREPRAALVAQPARDRIRASIPSFRSPAWC